MSGTQDEEFILTEAEKHGSLWLRLKAHLLGRLDRARRRNDDPGMSEHATAALRGEIKSLKVFINLGDDLPEVDE